MMLKILPLFAVSLAFNLSCLSAQSDTIPVSAVIHANNIRATVWSNGLLFSDGGAGAFFPSYTEQGPNIAPIQAAGLWLSLQDPGGGVNTDVVRRIDGGNDFIPGRLDPLFLQHRDFNKIWKVTREEILAHIADYRDNGIVDHPIPAIFAWPGKQNAFFEEYNDGMILPKVINPHTGLAPFDDLWGAAGQQHGRYEPDKGDYPIALNLIAEFGIPSEILWFSFHNTQSEGAFRPVEIHCCLYAYACGENEILNNTVFVDYLILNRGVEPYCTNVGMWADVAIGCPDDDYMGSTPEIDLLYAYNSDNVDEGCGNVNGYGENPPALGIRWVYPYYCYTPFCNDEAECNTYTLSFNENVGAPPGQRFPNNDYEIFRCLNGNWRDGSPLTFGGSGYQWSNEVVSHIFSGDPSDANQWSEISANRPPGKRRVLNALGRFEIDGQDWASALVAFSFAQAPGNNHLDQIKTLRDSMQHFTTGIVEGFVGIVCTTPLPVSSVEIAPEVSEILHVFPNPAASSFTVKSDDKQIRRITLLDGFGKTALQSAALDDAIFVGHLAPGLYLVKAEMEDGNLQMGKVVVVR